MGHRGAVRLIGDEQVEHHLARRFGALRHGRDLHAVRGLANAACRQHPLAFDLDHAGAAIAVGAVAGLGRIAQMRDIGAETLGHLPDRLAVQRLDIMAIQGEFDDRTVGVALGGAVLAPMMDMDVALLLGLAPGGTFFVMTVAERLVGLVTLAHCVPPCADGCGYQLPNGVLQLVGKIFQHADNGFGAA